MEEGVQQYLRMPAGAVKHDDDARIQNVPPSVRDGKGNGDSIF
jgi:hypothetical protein